MRYTEKNHPSHRHTLTLEQAPEPYVCDGCKQLGVDPCYHCRMCNFHLHEPCANAANTPLDMSPVIRRSFSRCRFQLRFNAPVGRGRYCDVCGHDVQGFRYQCQHGHDLHPCCMKLPYRMANRETGMEIHLREKARSRCEGCGTHEAANGVKGWCYVSSDGELCYHVSCIKNLAIERWREGRFGHSAYGQAVGSELERQGGGQGTAVARRGRGRQRGWMNRVLVFLRLVVSAVFGDPTALIAALVGSLF